MKAPSLYLLTRNPDPKGFFGCYAAYLKGHVPVPEELLELPFEQELQAVFALYIKRYEQILEESGDYITEGFSNSRTENQTLVFDVSMRLTNVL